MKLKVRSTSKSGFRRAGLLFGPEWTELDMNELSEEQFALLDAEPNLITQMISDDPSEHGPDISQGEKQEENSGTQEPSQDTPEKQEENAGDQEPVKKTPAKATATKGKGRGKAATVKTKAETGTEENQDKAEAQSSSQDAKQAAQNGDEQTPAANEADA